MKFVIPTHGRAAYHTTARLLTGLDYVYLVHDREAERDYRTHAADNGLDPARIVVTNTPHAPQHQRRWAIGNLGREGEWLAMLDDDVRKLTAVPEPWVSHSDLPTQEKGTPWQALFDTEASPTVWAYRCERLAAECDRLGFRLGGFAALRNAFFRGRRWRHVGYVESTFALIRAGRPEDWPAAYHMEDFAATAYHLLHYGGVVIDNFAFPASTHYTKGGLGPRPERVAARRRDMERFAAEYPGLYRVVDKKGGSDLRLRPNTPALLAKWRAGLVAR